MGIGRIDFHREGLSSDQKKIEEIVPRFKNKTVI